MSEKSILITGCSSGIGEACALGFHERGWRVFATARRDEDLARLNDASLEALYLDYTEPVSIAAAADQVLAATEGRLFALFNNGTYGQTGAVEDVPTDVLRAQFESGFFGWHDLTRRLLPAMRAQQAGRIVQCSSVLGLVPLPYRGAYCATKFALEGLSMAMRAELKDTGISVSVIQPGPIRSRFVETAARVFQETIDINGSPHRPYYEKRLSLLSSGGTTRFKLEPEAVLKKLIHAVESPYPRPNYFVTTPTYLMDAARRVLPARLLDRLIERATV